MGVNMKHLLNIALEFTKKMKDSQAVDTIAFACLLAVGFAILITFIGILIGLFKRILGGKK